MESSKELYSIDKIVNKKINEDGITQYEIKWEDYAETENTWQLLEILIEDKAFDSIFEFENTDFAKSLPMNEDTKNFLYVFEEYISDNRKQNEYGDFPDDQAEKILNITMDHITNEEYALISWKMRDNKIKPKDSWVNCKVLAVYDGELFSKFIKNLIEYNHKRKIIYNKKFK